MVFDGAETPSHLILEIGDLLDFAYRPPREEEAAHTQ
jgi:hypothetical protein